MTAGELPICTTSTSHTLEGGRNHRDLAGVTDAESASVAVDFARRYELLAKDEASKLNLAEVDPSDADALEGAIPRCRGDSWPSYCPQYSCIFKFHR